MYDRNRRNNWGKRGREMDFSTYQSENYFLMSACKTFVAVAAVTFENPLCISRSLFDPEQLKTSVGSRKVLIGSSH